MECKSYPTFSMVEPIDNVDQALHAVRETVSMLIPSLRSLGLEKDFLPMSFGLELLARLGNPAQIDISVILTQLRRIKDEEEISKLRESARVAAVGLKKGLGLVKPGIREIDILAQIKASMESEAAEPIEVFADIVSGPKTLKIGTLAAYARTLGEEGTCDPRHHGLRLDMAEPSSLLPHNDMPRSLGMVITIEPGLYDRKLGGVRLEDEVLVTETGAEVLEDLPKEVT